jgi:hypothetical protein
MGWKRGVLVGSVILLTVVACADRERKSVGVGEACNATTECSSAGPCLPNGAYACGGAAPKTCATDDDCPHLRLTAADGGDAGDGSIGPDSLVCGPGDCGSTCQRACQSDAECTDTTVCRAFHCVARPCNATSACGPNLECGADGTCTIKACRSDGDCGGGFCINGRCSAIQGKCASADLPQ